MTVHFDSNLAAGRPARSARAAAARAAELAIVILLAGCDGQDAGKDSARTAAPWTLRKQLMVVSSSPPQLVVSDAAGLDRAERFGRTLDAEAVLARAGARRTEADSLAWLTGSAPGRTFLASPLPRAVARGEPADHCPGVGVAGGEADLEPGDAALRRGRIVRRAVERCLAAVAGLPGCGCRVLAIDSVLTAPRAEMAYATGVTVRIRAPELGLDGVLVAEDEEDGATLLRDLRRPVGRLEREGAAGATLTLLDGEHRLTGRREVVGWRRGRLAERVYLEDAKGRRVVLLIGFSPGELAEGAAAGLAWPGGG